MNVVRVNVDDLRVTAARYEASSAELAGGAPAIGAGLSCQPSAAAVQAVHAGAATVLAVAAARAVDTGTGIAEADTCYVGTEVESVAQVRALLA